MMIAISDDSMVCVQLQGEAIHDAAHFGHRAAVEELIRQKADPCLGTKAVKRSSKQSSLNQSFRAMHGDGESDLTLFDII